MDKTIEEKRKEIIDNYNKQLCEAGCHSYDCTTTQECLRCGKEDN